MSASNKLAIYLIEVINLKMKIKNRTEIEEICLNHTLKVDHFKFVKPNGEKKNTDPVKASKILINHSALKYLRIFEKYRSYYLYNPSKGIYHLITDSELRILTRTILASLNDIDLLKPPYIKSILTDMKMNEEVSFLGGPLLDNKYIVFLNGVLNLDTGELLNFTPDIFQISYLPFNYDPTALAPKFHKFIEDIANGCKDSITFYRAAMKAVIASRVDLQFFVYIYGPGATGKSTLLQIMTAMVGVDAVHTTSLKALNSDPFEIINLIGKKLVLVTDTPKYEADISVVKAFTGGDSLRGRIMHEGVTTEVRPEGILFIASNYPLQTRDSSNSLLRRMRPMILSKKSTKRVSLLHYNPTTKGWYGELKDELSGMFNWAYTGLDDILRSHIVDYYKIPAFQQLLEESRSNISPLTQWVKEKNCRRSWILCWILLSG